MVQVFDDGFDDRIVHKNIDGPTADGYFEVGGCVYQHEQLSEKQDHLWTDHVNSVIQLGKGLK